LEIVDPSGIELSKRATFPFDSLTVDPGSGAPMARQLYDLLRSLILKGRLRVGDRLPATRVLSQQLKIARNTIIAAYGQLLAEGYVTASSGGGTWVALSTAKPTRPVRADDTNPKLSRRGELIARRPQPPKTPGKINLQPGYPEAASFPFSTWARLLARNAQQRGEDLLSYHDYSGHPRLRDVIANYLGVARGVDCDAEQVVIVTGAQAALDLVSRIIVDEGDCVWLEEPGYLGARSAFLGGGARLAALKITREGWHISDPSLPPPRAIYVTPSCQWPLGMSMRIEERLQLISVAERHNAWIIEDDYDGEYRFRGRPIPAMHGFDTTNRVIYVGTFGKTLFSSLRVGFLVVPRALSVSFSRAVSVTGQFAPLILQLTLADFIQQGYFAAHLKRMRRLYARRQKLFLELCDRHLSRWLAVAENDAGMQLLGRFVRPFDDQEVAAAALQRGVDVQPISINYQQHAQHGLLLGFAGLDERATLAAIAALQNTFRDLERKPGK
jgi:GntR family transcriptional regulator/MocR family aminotransferase